MKRTRRPARPSRSGTGTTQPTRSSRSRATPAAGNGQRRKARPLPGAPLKQAPVERAPITMRVNGTPVSATVDVRMTLVDFLRETAGLTGTHVGCEHGVCGACTILFNGEAVRSCLLFAVQAEGAEIATVESLGTPEHLHPLQEAFREHHGLQCGFCTPGILMSLVPFLHDHPRPTDAQIREVLSGHLCRCTGYQGIVEAVRDAAGRTPRA